MANWTSGILTNQGRDLQLKVEAGANLKVTRFKLGDGTETAADAKDLHDLIGAKIAFGITGIERTNGLCKFTGVVTSSNVAAGFRAREWGLFAEDPDKGEILYMVSLDDRPDYIAAQDAVLNSTFVYALNVDISQAAKIESVIDPTGLVTAEMLQKAAGLLQRNTTYALKDTVFDLQLAGHPSWRLVCTKAGTTSGTLLNLQNAKLNDVYTDGTAEWTVKDGYTSAVEEHNVAPNAHEKRFEEVMAALGYYLPLTGGVITGAIIVGNCPGMRKATDREETYLYGGTTNQDGAALGLIGINCMDYGEEARGSFSLVAISPSGERHTLAGLKDGRLLWDRKPIVYPEEIITWQSPTGEEWYYAIRWADGRAEIHGHAMQQTNKLGITLNYPFPLIHSTTGEATVVAATGTAFNGLVSFTFGTAAVGYFTVRYHDYSVPNEPISICFTVRGYWK